MNKKNNKKENGRVSEHTMFVRIIAGIGALAMFLTIFLTLIPCFR